MVRWAVVIELELATAWPRLSKVIMGIKMEVLIPPSKTSQNLIIYSKPVQLNFKLTLKTRQKILVRRDYQIARVTLMANKKTSTGHFLIKQV